MKNQDANRKSSSGHGSGPGNLTLFGYGCGKSDDGGADKMGRPDIFNNSSGSPHSTGYGLGSGCGYGRRSMMGCGGMVDSKGCG